MTRPHRATWTDADGQRWRGQLDRGARRLEAVLAELPRLWDAHAGWVPREGRIGADGEWTAQSAGPRRLRLARAGAPQAEVWTFEPRPRWWGRPTAARAHAALHALRARGYAAPRPLGWMAPDHRRVASFLLQAPVPAPTVASCLRRGLEDEERRQLRGALVHLLRRWAADGIVHPGLGAERLRWWHEQLIVGDVDGIQLRRGPAASLRVHLELLGRDPALAEVAPWDRARVAWRCLSGTPGRRALLRDLDRRTRAVSARPSSSPPGLDVEIEPPDLDPDADEHRG